MSVTAEPLNNRLESLGHSLRWHWNRMPERAAERGLPPPWTGWRAVAGETVPEYFERRRLAGAAPGSSGLLEVIHEQSIAANPLPRNISDRRTLPADRGWWGYSFRDVPERISAPTYIAALPDCRIVSYDEESSRDFYPAILNQDDRSLNLREVKFRARHGEVMRAGRTPMRLERATWIWERVYHNHSHWLTAHLPKLCLLKERGELGDLVLPARRTQAMDASLRRLGIDPKDHPIYDAARPLEVGVLTLLSTDRFRPELLRPVRDALAPARLRQPSRRIFISRGQAARRRLLNEDELWPIAERQGFEKVLMETLSFEEQIQLMGETAVLLAPHGAGLTNMMFCQPGAQVIEIADLGFPNPNFYAVASAMGLNYWLVPAEGVGEMHPLEKDLRVDTAAVREVLEAV